MHCLRHSQERRTGFQEDRGHPTTAESWITLPATLPRKTDKVSRGWGHPTAAESWIALPVTLPRNMDKVSRGLSRHPTTAESWIALPATLPRKDRVSRGRGHPTTAELDCIACDPPKKDGQGFKRMGEHPTTAEGWIALPATLPRKTRFQEDRGILLLQRVGSHCLRPSQERQTRFQEDGSILLLQRVGSHRLRPSQERQTGFQEDGGILLLQRVGGLCVLQTAWSTSHTQLHDNPTSSTMMTHIQLHNSPDLRHTPDELGPAGCRCGSTGGNSNLYSGT